MSALTYIKKIAKETRCQRRNLQFLKHYGTDAQFNMTKLLVIAPHPDDETIGAGGLIAMHRARSMPVSVVFLTSGEASNRRCCEIDPAIVATRRQNQAQEAMARLGVSQDALYWMELTDSNIPDRKNPAFNQVVEALAWIIQHESPDEILCPHPEDGWQDHENAYHIVDESSRRIGNDTRIFNYFIWAPYNLPKQKWDDFRQHHWRKLDILPVLKDKRAALDCYFKGELAPCGSSWAGRLPWALINQAKGRYEFFISSAVRNES